MLATIKLPQKPKILGQCNTLVMVPSGPVNSNFISSHIDVEYTPAAIEAAEGKTMRWRYWRIIDHAEAGPVLLRFADCLIPRSQQARDQAFAHFRRGAMVLGTSVTGPPASWDCPGQDLIPICDPVFMPCPGAGGSGSGPTEVALSCDAASVGHLDTLICIVTKAGETNSSFDGAGISWTFSAPGYSASEGAVNMTSWAGPMAISGTIKVSVDGFANEPTQSVTVERRAGFIWDPLTDFHHTRGGGEHFHESLFLPRTGNSAGAKLCPIDGCSLAQHTFVTPAYRNGAGFGFTTAEIPSGPNKGLHYVSDASFQLRSASALNLYLLSTAGTWSLTYQPQVDFCRSEMGLPAGSSLTVNFHIFNSCMGVDMPGLLSGLMDHEEDHWTDMINAAGSPANDARAVVEDLVASSKADLVNLVRIEVNAVNSALLSSSPNEPTGNFSANTWWWDDSPAEKRFKFILWTG